MPQVTLELSEELLSKIDAQAPGKHGLDRNSVIRKMLEAVVNSKREMTSEEMLSYSRRIHEAVKAQIAEEYPELKRPRTPEQIKKDFDRITKKIRKQIPFKSLEEMERAMRGDDFGLVRY